MDQAKVRDLKLVYDLQLDREISARREYELSVETQLRRELVSELRAQAADEVAGLRAELAALRANLEILFDADLSHRPALETDRAGARAYDDWSPTPETAGRVTASRIDTEDRDDTRLTAPTKARSSTCRGTASARVRMGAARRVREARTAGPRRPNGSPAAVCGRRAAAWRPAPDPEPPPPPAPPPPPVPPPTDNERTTQFSWPPGQEPPPAPLPRAPPPQPNPVPDPTGSRLLPRGGGFRRGRPVAIGWRRLPRRQTPPVRPAVPLSNGSADEYVGRRRAPAPDAPAFAAGDVDTTARAASARPAFGAPRGRRPRQAPAPPTLAAESARATASCGARSRPSSRPRSRRHRSSDDAETGGQSVADLLARLQAAPSGGGRRRRRDE